MYYSYLDDCAVTQEFCPSIEFLDTEWRTDLLLPQPQLRAPRADAVICLDSQAGQGTNIILEWYPVAGATEYIVQWGNNPQMTGPSLREAKIADPNVTYELIHGDDIRLGETVYWRVIAVNETQGGVSSKSETRQLTFNCSGLTNRDPDFCSDYDVEMKIGGQDFMSCCDKNVFWLQLTYACKDQFGRQLVTVDNIEWSTDVDPNTPGAAVIDKTLANDYRVIVQTCGEDKSQVFRLQATITFTDQVTGQQFECSASRKVFMDCDTPYQTRPWAFNANTTGCYALCIPDEYSSDEPLGAMYEAGPILDYPSNIVVATGPVFKIPIDTCNGIYTPCCYCVPENLLLYMDSLGSLTWDETLGQWVSDDTFKAFGCESGGLQNAALYCYDQENWHFEADLACDGCIAGAFCDCTPDVIQVTVTYTFGAQTGDITSTLTQSSGNFWIGDTITFTPNGCTESLSFQPVFDLSNAAITGNITSFNPPWALDGPITGAQQCGPPQHSGQIFFDMTHPVCGTVNIEFKWVVADCSPCFDPLTLSHDFQHCESPFDTSFQLMDPYLPEPMDVRIYEGEVCNCGDELYGTQSAALEARVNIPLSCHFTMENGYLALNLDNLLGPGFTVATDPTTGCPYIEGGNFYPIVYCCTTIQYIYA